MRVVTAFLVCGLTLANCSDSETTAPPTPTELTIEAGTSLFAIVGDEVVFDEVVATGASSFVWNFGNGERWDAPRDDARATITYDKPGRYTAVVSAFDEGGNKRADSLVVTVTHPLVHEPRQSSTIAVADGEVAVVSPDTGELTRMTWDDDA